MGTAKTVEKHPGLVGLPDRKYGVRFFLPHIERSISWPRIVGLLTFAVAFTGIFGLLLDLGLNSLAVREVARDKSRANEYLSNITFIKLTMGVITFGLTAVVVHSLGYAEETIAVVYLLTLSIVFSAVTTSFYVIFQSFERMEYQSVAGILTSLLMLTGAILLIARGAGVVAFAAVSLITSALF